MIGAHRQPHSLFPDSIYSNGRTTAKISPKVNEPMATLKIFGQLVEAVAWGVAVAHATATRNHR